MKTALFSQPVRPAGLDGEPSVADLVAQMSGMSLQARNTGRCAEVLKRMPKESGSTLNEARSWGKVKGDADVAMAWVEPSVSVPLLAGYVLGRRLAEGRSRLRFSCKGERLVSLQESAGTKSAR